LHPVTIFRSTWVCFGSTCFDSNILDTNCLIFHVTNSILCCLCSDITTNLIQVVGCIIFSSKLINCSRVSTNLTDSLYHIWSNLHYSKSRNRSIRFSIRACSAIVVTWVKCCISWFSHASFFIAIKCWSSGKWCSWTLCVCHIFNRIRTTFCSICSPGVIEESTSCQVLWCFLSTLFNIFSSS